MLWYLPIHENNPLETEYKKQHAFLETYLSIVALIGPWFSFHSYSQVPIVLIPLFLITFFASDEEEATKTFKQSAFGNKP